MLRTDLKATWSWSKLQGLDSQKRGQLVTLGPQGSRTQTFEGGRGYGTLHGGMTQRQNSRTPTMIPEPFCQLSVPNALQTPQCLKEIQGL